jgi:hypothetical protein
MRINFYPGRPPLDNPNILAVNAFNKKHLISATIFLWRATEKALSIGVIGGNQSGGI